MQKKTILNLITLAVTTFLLVLVVFSWYVSNKEVRASGIIASTAGEDYSLKLQRGKFEYSNGEWKWTWEDSDSMTFSNIEPGSALFFRIVVDTSAAHEFSVKFSNVQSSIKEDTLVAYNEKSLVTYSKTSDTTKVSGKSYYTGVFSKASVTAGNTIKKYTYYELDNNSYKITTDTVFSGSKDYYLANFYKENNPDLSKNTYYEKSAEPTGINAVGYKYDTNSIKYLYPLDNNSVKINSTKTLYNTNQANVSLKDYLIEDVFKVYDIGSKYNNTFYTDEFNQNDNLYNSTYKITEDTTFNPKKTYYVKQNIPTSSTNEKYVLSMDNSFVSGKTYYEKDSVGNALYSNALLKTSEATFETNTASTKTYYYFALEFNDSLSLKNIYGEISSNCYLYQVLKIKELQVNKES